MLAAAGVFRRIERGAWIADDLTQREPGAACGAATSESVAIPAVLLRVRTPRFPGKKPVDHRGKGPERHRVVVGVERGLVIFVAEVDAERKCRMTAVLLARVPIEPEMMEIEI